MNEEIEKLKMQLEWWQEHYQLVKAQREEFKKRWLAAEERFRKIKEKMTGTELINAERYRQISILGWSQEHDQEHDGEELALAAAAYALPKTYDRLFETHTVNGEELQRGYDRLDIFPFNKEWWKPSRDRVRELVKAGALIAAEIDRLKALNDEEPS